MASASFSLPIKVSAMVKLDKKYLTDKTKSVRVFV